MWKKITAFFEAVGTARAANQLAQMGYYTEAKNLMLRHAEVKQTMKELNALSDRELNDIGISRGDIFSIAHNLGERPKEQAVA